MKVKLLRLNMDGKSIGLLFLLASISLAGTSSEENGSLETSKQHKGNILFFHSLGTKSHLILMSALAEGLASHGYNVTAVWYARMPQENTANYTQLTFDDGRQVL